jgi:hypothetical protein
MVWKLGQQQKENFKADGDKTNSLVAFVIYVTRGKRY